MILEVVPEQRSGNGKRSDIVRVKTYYKEPEDVEAFAPWPEVACAWLPRAYTIAEANDVAMIDTATCQMRCHGCYWRGRSTETVLRTPREIVDDFVQTAGDCPVWRVSGGEPTLEPELPELITALQHAAGDNHIVVVNTNGAHPERIPVYPRRVFPELSIKGLTPELRRWNSGVEEQPDPLDTLRALLTAGHQTLVNCWTVVPGAWTSPQARAAMHDFCDTLKQLHRGLPLIVTWVHPAPYEWATDIPPHWDAQWMFDYWLTEQDYSVGELLTPVWVWARRVATDVGMREV
jgi:pyruvate-formate lyase-activating enzyme